MTGPDQYAKAEELLKHAAALYVDLDSIHPENPAYLVALSEVGTVVDMAQAHATMAAAAATAAAFTLQPNGEAAKAWRDVIL